MSLIVADNSESAGRLVAEIVANRLYAFPDLQVALPTGRTPEPMYKHLQDLWDAGSLPAQRATLSQIDEYVGPDAGQMQAELEAGVGPISWAERIFWDTDASIEQVIQRPQHLDLLVLGIGANGHVAFSEPGCPDNIDFYQTDLSEETVRQNNVLSRSALTMGISYMRRSREIVMLVTGKHKAQILAEALEGPVTNTVPASLLRDKMTVVCDKEAAASLLQKRRHIQKRAVVAVGCKQNDGSYSAAADGRTIKAAKRAAQEEAALLVLSGGVISGRETEARHMLQAVPDRIETPILLEEASDRSAQHIFFVEPLLRALDIKEATLVTSWWHLPRFLAMNKNWRIAPAWDLRGMFGQQRIRNEIAAMRWVQADHQEAASRFERRETRWLLRGEEDLQDLSGWCSAGEARARVALALERSPSVFDFDQNLEGRLPGGPLLSGSQLLEALS